jgi:hypothetical protein
MLLDEESVRVRHKVAEGLAARDWVVPEDLREPVRKVLPYGFRIDGAGKVKKRD